jgi:hypothetical protein
MDGIWCLVSQPYGSEFQFLGEFFWVADSSSVYQYGLLHVFGEVFWFEFFEFSLILLRVCGNRRF